MTWQQPPPWQPPPVGSYGGRQASLPASSEAVTALVLAIGSFLCAPLGIVAIFIGMKARRLCRENPGQVGGDQMALAAIIIGSLIAAINFLTVLGYVGMIVAFSLMHGAP